MPQDQSDESSKQSTELDSPKNLAELVADAVEKHPAVIRLDGGTLGMVATHLPGRKVLGIRLIDGELVEVSVVLTLGARVPQVSTELRTAVRALTGEIPVHITVTDIVESQEGQAVKTHKPKPTAKSAGTTKSVGTAKKAGRSDD